MSIIKKSEKYITIIKCENDDWKIGFGITGNLNEHKIFKNEMLECNDVEKVKILKVKEI